MTKIGLVLSMVLVIVLALPVSAGLAETDDEVFMSFDDESQVTSGAVFYDLRYDAAKAEWNTDPSFVKAGKGSLKVTADELKDSRPGVNASDLRMLFTYRNTDGETAGQSLDWSAYSGISFWIYLPEHTYEYLDVAYNVRSLQVALQDQKVRWWVPKSDLKVGWNYIECDFSSPSLEQAPLNTSKIDHLFINLYAQKDGYKSSAFYVDEITLMKK